MTWVVGIDEAGYGPNLGPLVMTAVACRVPGELAGADLWEVLRAAVRRHTDEADGRLLVADSKLVYSPNRGLRDLEAGVLSLLAPELADQDLPLADYLDRTAPACHAALHGEHWYAGDRLLPVAAERDGCLRAAEQFRQACRPPGLELRLVRSVVVCAPLFNELLDRWGSKGAVLGHALQGLLACHGQLGGPGEAVHVFIDKHGGRNTYAAMLQDALGGGLVVAEREGREQSVYRVVGLSRDVRLTIQPRADVDHFCVALASMASKYLREVLMQDFNAYWQRHVPGLKPTAGYPTDAARFFEAIRPALRRLGLDETAVWRRK